MKKTIEESIAENRELKVLDSYSQGFNIVFKKPMLFIGFLIVQVVIALLLSLVPDASLINSFFLQPLFTIGMLVVADKINYQDEVSFNNFFDGFKGRIGTVIGANFLKILAMLPVIGLIGYAYGSMVGWENLQAIFAQRPEDVDIVAMDFSGTNSILIFLGAIVILVISILFSFTFHMIRFKELSASGAIAASVKLAGKNFGGLFLFILMAMVVNLAGALLLGLGLLITIPATYCALYVIFDDLVKAREEESEEDAIMDHFIS